MHFVRGVEVYEATRTFLPGMHVGFPMTYLNASGVLHKRNVWMKCTGYEHMTGVVSGIGLHDDQEYKVYGDLIFSTQSPYEHT